MKTYQMIVQPRATRLLAEVYTETVKSDQVTQDDLDIASEAAIEAISYAGFDDSDSDQLGSAMASDVQTLLTLAFLRCPELKEGLGL